MDGPTELGDNPIDNTTPKLEVRNFSDREIQEILDGNDSDYSTQDPTDSYQFHFPHSTYSLDWPDTRSHYLPQIGISPEMYNWPAMYNPTTYNWSGTIEPKIPARDICCLRDITNPHCLDCSQLDAANALNCACKGKPSSTKSEPRSQPPPDPDNLDFLKFDFCRTATTLAVCAEDGHVLTIIKGLDLARLNLVCPLLGHSFEERESGFPQGTIVTFSKTAFICVLRYIYTQDYIEGDPLYISLLLRAQVYKLAENYEIPALQIKVNADFLREIKLSSSSIKAPEDLCEAIRFIYERQMEETPFFTDILNYCVQYFSSHGLGGRQDFRSLSFEIRNFTQALCRASFQRGFGDEGALEIVCLQTTEPAPSIQADPSGVMFYGYMYDSDDVDSSSDVESHSDVDPCSDLDSYSDIGLHSDVERQVQSQRGTNKIRERSNKVVLRPSENNLCISVEEKGEKTWAEKKPHDFTFVHRPKAPAAWDYYDNDADNDADFSLSEEDAISDLVLITKPADRTGIREMKRAQPSPKTPFDDGSESEWSII